MARPCIRVCIDSSFDPSVLKRQTCGGTHALLPRLLVHTITHIWLFSVLSMDTQTGDVDKKSTTTKSCEHPIQVLLMPPSSVVGDAEEIEREFLRDGVFPSLTAPASRSHVEGRS